MDRAGGGARLRVRRWLLGLLFVLVLVFEGPESRGMAELVVRSGEQIGSLSSKPRGEGVQRPRD